MTERESVLIMNMFLLQREKNLQQFVSLEGPGFKLVERVLPMTISQGLLLWGRVD